MEKGIIKRFINGKASPEEVRKVLKWYYSDEVEYFLSEQIEEQWKNYKGANGMKDFQKSEVFRKIRKKINNEGISFEEKKTIPIAKKEEVTWRISVFMKIAASFILLVCVSILFFYWEKPSSMPPSSSEKTLAKYVTKSTAEGQKFSIYLGDGSKIKLNSESSLRFPARFSDSIRVVYLSGEAFFEIKRDPDRLFKVITDNLETTALGTTFNVRAFPDMKHVIVSLADGKVKVNPIKGNHNISEYLPFEIFLDPGLQAIYSTENQAIKKKSFNAKKEFSWKDGIIYFEDSDWKCIVKQLERWYGVDFIMNNHPIQDKLYTGSFKNESLENVLESLSFSKNFDFEFKDKKVYISFKNK